jgi:predicted amidohydrolase
LLTTGGHQISPAICYELSVPAHADLAVKNGASIYMASVAKTGLGIDMAEIRLSEIARQYSIPVMMSNCIGFCDHFLAAGRSSVWNKEGERLGQLNDSQEGLLIYDTDTGEVLEMTAG